MFFHDFKNTEEAAEGIRQWYVLKDRSEGKFFGV